MMLHICTCSGNPNATVMGVKGNCSFSLANATTVSIQSVGTQALKLVLMCSVLVHRRQCGKAEI